MVEQEFISSQKGITDKWLDGIHENLQRLETYQRLANEGCNSIMEYVQSIIRNPSQALSQPVIQHKNYKMFMSEFEILISNIPKLVNKEEMEDILLHYDALKLYEYNCKGFIRYNVDQRNDLKKPYLKKEFQVALEKISVLRSKVVVALWKILSPDAKDQMEGPPK